MRREGGRYEKKTGRDVDIYERCRWQEGMWKTQINMGRDGCRFGKKLWSGVDKYKER